MIFSHRRSAPRRGVAAVELAVLLPFITILLLGTWEVGRLIEVNQILSNSAREGARQACTGMLSNTQLQNIVLNYLTNAGIPTTHVTVTVSDLTTPGTDATSAAQLDQMQIKVTIPCEDVTYVPLDLVTNPSSTMTALAVWCSVRDKDYPTTVAAPPGY
jgi:Flp pilus assembly protein TadG